MTVDTDTPAGRRVLVAVARLLADDDADPEVAPLELADMVLRGWLTIDADEAAGTVRLAWDEGGEAPREYRVAW